MSFSQKPAFFSHRNWSEISTVDTSYFPVFQRGGETRTERSNFVEFFLLIAIEKHIFSRGFIILAWHPRFQHFLWINYSCWASGIFFSTDWENQVPLLSYHSSPFSTDTQVKVCQSWQIKKANNFFYWKFLIDFDFWISDQKSIKPNFIPIQRKPIILSWY